MQEGQFQRVVELMTKMATGDTAAAFDLYSEFGAVIRRVLRAHLADLNARAISDAELDGLVLDAVMALLDASPSWRPDGGAMPWTWAERRLRALVSGYIGQWTDEFDDRKHDTVAPSAPRVTDRDDMAHLARVARDNEVVALLIEALAQVCSERDGQILIAVKAQAEAGDPSPSNTIAAERGMTPAAVRQVVKRTRTRVLNLAARDGRFAPLAELPLLMS
jgi:hypothetical protein